MRGLTGGATASPVGTAVATGISLFFSSSPEELFEGFGFGFGGLPACLRGGGFATFAFDMTGMLGPPFSFLSYSFALDDLQSSLAESNNKLTGSSYLAIRKGPFGRLLLFTTFVFL